MWPVNKPDLCWRCHPCSGSSSRQSQSGITSGNKGGTSRSLKAGSCEEEGEQRRSSYQRRWRKEQCRPAETGRRRGSVQSGGVGKKTQGKNPRKIIPKPRKATQQ
ncbi:hypothetical protein NDU88_005740 [Pleurodeles waltl]|uniref:Uncharacterized protein n=1 Tax=Pleurodeles waltl TaxID=8319 RepID=A0AAV7N120_PLEWA|nr:hypothetical protein NDU88_005740 [Pleurodeles waltl]